MTNNLRKFLTLAAIVCTVSAARAQQTNTYEGSAGGKETINTNWKNHWYMITLVNNKTTALCVDNKKIADNDLVKYDSIINRIVHQVRLDEAQGEKDRAQAEKDRAQADRDREQADRDRQQADRDRAQAELDRQQADRDRAQADRDRAQAELDRQQAERDRQKAAEDRENMRKLIALLVDKKLIPDAASLKDLVLTDDELLINGKKASPEIHQELKKKYAEWARLGLSYGNQNNCCTSVHFHIGSPTND